MALLHAALCALVPLLTTAALYAALFERAGGAALGLAAAAVAATALRFPALSLQLSLSYAAAFRAGAELRGQLLAHMRRLSLGEVRRVGSGRLAGMFNDDVKRIEAFVGGGFGLAVSALATPLILLLCVYAIDPLSGLILSGGIAIGFPFVKLFAHVMRRGIDERSVRINALSSRIGEHFSGMAVLRSFNATGLADRDLKADMKALRRHYRASAKAITPFSAAGLFIMEAAFIACSLAGLAAIDARLSPQALAFVLIIGLSLYNPLLLFLGGLGQYRLAATAADNIGEFLALPVEAPRESAAVAGAERGLRFDKVSFRYESNAENALDEVSFVAEAGQLTAIVGPSGAGKSSIFNLVAQFWCPQRGTIRIDGRDLSDIPPEDWVKLVALVSQDTVLINDTLRRNVDLGRPGIDEQRIDEALKEARCGDFLARLPDGLEAPVGENGARLSGGEKQRIAIARSFLKDAPFVLLDEATNSVDASNARLIQEAIHALTRQRSVVLIAHQLSSIVDADKIIVMDKGRVVAQGRHGELLETSPLYGKLWNDHCETRRWKIAGAGGPPGGVKRV